MSTVFVIDFVVFIGYKHVCVEKMKITEKFENGTGVVDANLLELFRQVYELRRRGSTTRA